MRDMLPRLFFTHFRDTSFVAEEDGELAGFLCGFLSQTYPEQAYCHFVGVAPAHRHDRPRQPSSTSASSTAARSRGTHLRALRHHVRRTPRSIAFHTRIGFEIEAEVEGYDGSGESRVLLAKTL